MITMYSTIRVVAVDTKPAALADFLYHFGTLFLKNV
jgi:hypothetical protein